MEQPDFLERFDYRNQPATQFAAELLNEIKMHPELEPELAKAFGVPNINEEFVRVIASKTVLESRVRLGDLMTKAAQSKIKFHDPRFIGAIAGIEQDQKALAEEFYRNFKKGSSKEAILDEIKTSSDQLKQILFWNAQAMTADDLIQNPENHPDIKFNPTKKVITDEERRKVFQIQFDFINAQDEVYRRSSRTVDLKEKSKQFLSQVGVDIKKSGPAFFKHLDDPFITDSLSNAVSEDQTARPLKFYHACQYLDWVARLQMLDAIDAKMLKTEYVSKNSDEVRQTDQPLSLADVQKQILHDPYGQDNRIKKWEEFKNWMKRH